MPRGEDKGVPYRHTKDKAQLLLEDYAKEGYSGLAKIIGAMEHLIEKRPLDALDALIKVSGDKD